MDNFFTGNRSNDNFSRNFSKGKSFQFSGIWNETTTYNNDAFIQDFVVWEEKLWGCIVPTSTNSRPGNSNHWQLILEGVSDIVFDKDGNKIVWRYDDESTWRELIEFDIVSESEIKNMLDELNMQQGGAYDSTLDANSVNAVQNRVVTEAISNINIEIVNLDTKKVDKISGKQLSTNDFTNFYKNKLDELENYDDREINLKFTELLHKVDEKINNKADKNEIVTPLIAVTYNDLKTMRGSSQLVPGQQYRITDYVTTTTQKDTQSANHQFDVIVTADDINILNENARAIQHTNDENDYFHNSDLAAWQIWYCLDNDTSRFAWADATNGKGVIYRMIDEHNNDCPYDFKNIQFKHPNSTTTDSNYYTFSTVLSEVVNDHSLGEYCYGNKIGLKIDSGKQQLNVIVFINKATTSICTSNSFGKNCHSNSFRGNCYSNSFGDDCYSNSFGDYCHHNSFGQQCYCNTFRNSCHSNSFSQQCHHNSFGNYCYYNSFGIYCYSNSFGNECYSNSFGNECYSNSFGIYCYSNSFGNECYSNSFGNDCRYNSFSNLCYSNNFGNNCQNNSFSDNCYKNHFGNGCYGNSFKNNCHDNSFGIGCGYNSFGNSCKFNSFGESTKNIKSYYRYIIFDDGNSYINLNCTTTTSTSNYYQNVRIGLGVNNKSTYKTITDGNVGQTYETLYKPADSKELTA